MTSITTASVFPGAVPASVPEEVVAPSVDRFRIGAGSKAVRMGLGVAIAAVMAGDVYAVLRMPVSEGAHHASAAREAAGATGAAKGAAVAEPAPFAAAIDAALTGAGRTVVATGGLGGLTTAKPVAPVVPALPSTSGPATAVVTLPDPASTSSTPIPTFTSSPSSASDPDPTPPAPPAESTSPLAPVVAVVESLVAGTPAEGVATTVAEELPLPGGESGPSSAAVVPLPVAVPSSNLPL